MRNKSEFQLVYSHFPEFFTKILLILLKIVNFFEKIVVDFIFKDKKYCRLILLKILVNYSKMQPFSSKTARNMFH